MKIYLAVAEIWGLKAFKTLPEAVCRCFPEVNRNSQPVDSFGVIPEVNFIRFKDKIGPESSDFKNNVAGYRLEFTPYCDTGPV